ncbi:hypothetical protein [Methanosarcina sp.]
MTKAKKRCSGLKGKKSTERLPEKIGISRVGSVLIYFKILA